VKSLAKKCCVTGFVGAFLLASGTRAQTIITETAVPPPTTVAAPNIRLTKAKALANVLAPEDLVETLGVANFEKGLRVGLKSNVEHQKMENSYPGLTDAVVAAVRPRGRELIQQNREPYLIKVGAFFAERFTVAELDQGHRFYSLPFMVRTNRAMLQSMQSDAVIADVRAQIANGSKDPSISMAAIKRDIVQGSRKAVAQLSPTEMRQVAAFSRTPFAIKFQNHQVALNRIVGEAINDQVAQISSDEVLRTNALAAMAEFVARADVAKAAVSPAPVPIVK
jgi:hypothetical protein